MKVINQCILSGIHCISLHAFCRMSIYNKAYDVNTIPWMKINDINNFNQVLSQTNKKIWQ